MNFILIIAPAGSINNETVFVGSISAVSRVRSFPEQRLVIEPTVFVICGGCCFYHKSGTLKKGPMTIKKQLTEGLNGVVAFTVES